MIIGVMGGRSNPITHVKNSYKKEWCFWLSLREPSTTLSLTV
ncbi:hypothetical protein HMPREF0812_01559 [Streptococcus agalactiae]|nr:hypothetical protein HMPREF0812_01559 [Streptococcus agalactiae]